MRGIDVSHWNGTPFNSVTEQAYREADFVITKATQGTAYKDTALATNARKALKDGKLLGFYHYATGGDPAKEADFFLAAVAPWKGQAVLALDWEQGQNKAWGNTSWCKQFADRVKQKWGINPLIYVQASAVKQAASCATTCKLWIAGYPQNANSWSVPAFKYSCAPWKDYAIWQYTSGGGKIDRNTCKLSKAQWRELATPATAAQKQAKKTVQELVQEVLAGKWGDYPQRRQRLLAAGYPATEVQQAVNALKSKGTVKVGVAVKVKQGAPVWGTRTLFSKHVYRTTYRVYQLTGNRAVICDNNTIIGAVDVKYLVVV